MKNKKPNAASAPHKDEKMSKKKTSSVSSKIKKVTHGQRVPRKMNNLNGY
jgi:hypothetical protein